MKKLTWLTAVLILLGLTSVSADCGFGMMGGYGYTGMMGGFMWFFGFIFWILILIALVLLIMWLLKQVQEPKRKR